MSDQHKHGGGRPQYSVQRHSISTATRRSTASRDSEDASESHLHEPNMPEVAPLRLHKRHTSPHGRGRFMGTVTGSNCDAHASNHQHISDHGPQVRQSRLPLFKQVRSILHKPPPLFTSNANHPDRPRETRLDTKKAQVAKRASRASLRGAFEVRRNSPPQSTTGSPGISPVSMLADDEWEQTIPPASGWNHDIQEPSPVFAVAGFPTCMEEEGTHRGPTPIAINTVFNSETHDFVEASPTARLVKQKPARRPISFMEDPPPPIPPPAVPPKYKTPPVQSILSRHRPIQRFERHGWTPPPRKSSATASTTPSSARSKLSRAPGPMRSVSLEGGTPRSAQKQLPLPPDMVSPRTPLSHLEALLREEQDKLHQRRNVEHAMVDLERIQKASPMEVTFAQVRDANTKLQELRATLEQIGLEEREIGIKIARARRKEGDEETGLWIRRVTG